MLGFILVSPKNHIVLLEGDESFNKYISQKIEIEIRQPLEFASTSSGIVTDITDQRLTMRKRSKRLSSTRHSLEEVTHILLPLISLCRVSTALGDSIEKISTGGSQVTFKEISNKCLVICIGKTDERSRMLNDFCRSLSLNLGPFIEVLENDYCYLKQSKDNIVASVMKQINEQKPFNDTIDLRKTAFHRNVAQKLFPLVKSICTQLQLFLGSNRCLLLCDNKLLLSTHSVGNDKPLTTHLDTRDLQGLVSQVGQHGAKLKEAEISQLWIRSKSSVIPFFVNVIRCKLCSNLVLVCLHPTKTDKFIRLVVLILMQLEQIQPECNIERNILEINESVNELIVYLKGFMVEKDSYSDYPFLRNPIRSAQFFKALWLKLSGDLTKAGGLNEIPKHYGKKFSISSMKSALSSFTLVASTLSLRNNNGKTIHEIPLKVDVQLHQWRRQIMSLLIELCSLARKDATTYKLPLFHDTFKRILKPHHEKLIADCSKKMLEAERQYEKFLKPVDYKLDMLGYCLKDLDKNLELSYESDDLIKYLPSWRYTSILQNHCVDIVSDGGRSFTIYQICGSRRLQKTPRLKSLLGSQPPPQLLPPEFAITAVFDGYVHKELASKQIESLVKLLRVHLSESSILFF